MNEDDKKAMEKAWDHWKKDWEHWNKATTIGLSHMPIPSFSAGFEAGMAHARGVSDAVIASLRGENEVLRDLLECTIPVLETVSDDDSEDWMMAIALCEKIKAASGSRRCQLGLADITTELLRCPFCGGVPQVFKRTMTFEQSHWLASICCHCGEYSSCAYQFGVGRTHDEAMENAVRKWNKRAGHTAIQHALECSQREGMMLRNLLAVIHGDGGQHAKAMGIEQACTDAEKFVVEMISALDCVKNIDALIEQATLAEREACALTCVKQAERLDGPSDAKGVSYQLAGEIRARGKR